MATRTILPVREVRQNISRLLDEAVEGEPVMIPRHGRPAGWEKREVGNAGISQAVRQRGVCQHVVRYARRSSDPENVVKHGLPQIRVDKERLDLAVQSKGRRELARHRSRTGAWFGAGQHDDLG